MDHKEFIEKLAKHGLNIKVVFYNAGSDVVLCLNNYSLTSEDYIPFGYKSMGTYNRCAPQTEHNYTDEDFKAAIEAGFKILTKNLDVARLTTITYHDVRDYLGQYKSQSNVERNAITRVRKLLYANFQELSKSLIRDLRLPF